MRKKCAYERFSFKTFWGGGVMQRVPCYREVATPA